MEFVVKGTLLFMEQEHIIYSRSELKCPVLKLTAGGQLIQCLVLYDFSFNVIKSVVFFLLGHVSDWVKTAIFCGGHQKSWVLQYLLRDDPHCIDFIWPSFQVELTGCLFQKLATDEDSAGPPRRLSSKLAAAKEVTITQRAI